MVIDCENLLSVAQIMLSLVSIGWIGRVGASKKDQHPFMSPILPSLIRGPG